jgi:glutamate formiminotransferase/formiminotetrahydrofolate cyclodeaminase
LNVVEFCAKVSSEEPAPGGGSVSALIGALGASLGAMVANLSANKRGWESQIPQFSEIAVHLQQSIAELIRLVNEDTAAYTAVMYAYKLPQISAAEKEIRAAAIESANQAAVSVPLAIAKQAAQALPFVQQMAQKGNQNAITDAGVGALALLTAVKGAVYNVRVNLKNIQDQEFIRENDDKCTAILSQTEKITNEITNLVESVISH